MFLRVWILDVHKTGMSRTLSKRPQQLRDLHSFLHSLDHAPVVGPKNSTCGISTVFSTICTYTPPSQTGGRSTVTMNWVLRHHPHVQRGVLELNLPGHRDVHNQRNKPTHKALQVSAPPSRRHRPGPPPPLPPPGCFLTECMRHCSPPWRWHQGPRLGVHRPARRHSPRCGVRDVGQLGALDDVISLTSIALYKALADTSLHQPAPSQGSGTDSLLSPTRLDPSAPLAKKHSALICRIKTSLFFILSFFLSIWDHVCSTLSP